MNKFFVLGLYDNYYPIVSDSKESFLRELKDAINEAKIKRHKLEQDFLNLTGHSFFDINFKFTKEDYENPENKNLIDKVHEIYKSYASYSKIKVCKNSFNIFEFKDIVENEKIDKMNHILTIDEFWNLKTITD